jgi:P27 family predicted phage terminase small subunit
MTKAKKSNSPKTPKPKSPPERTPAGADRASAPANPVRPVTAKTEAVGRAEAKRTALLQQLQTRGFKPEDVEDFVEVYVQAYTDYHEANEKLRAQTVLMRDSRGGVVRNPWFDIRDRAAATMDRVAESLGLLPSAPKLAVPSLASYLDAISDPAGPPKTHDEKTILH